MPSFFCLKEENLKWQTNRPLCSFEPFLPMCYSGICAVLRHEAWGNDSALRWERTSCDRQVSLTRGVVLWSRAVFFFFWDESDDPEGPGRCSSNACSCISAFFSVSLHPGAVPVSRDPHSFLYEKIRKNTKKIQIDFRRKNTKNTKVGWFSTVNFWQCELTIFCYETGWVVVCGFRDLWYVTVI